MNAKIQPYPTAKQLPLETEPDKKQPKNEAEVGKLKTELALGKQEEQLAALNRAKSPKNRDAAQKSNNPEKSDSLPKQANSPPPPPTNRAPDPISRPTPVPMPVSSTLAPSREPANFPPVNREPVYREPVSRPSSVVPAAVNSPPPKSVPTPEPQLQEPKKESTNPVNPLEQWMALKELGSYGNPESDKTQGNGESLTPSTEESAVTSATADELLQPENGSTSLNQNEERVATVPQASLVVRNHEIDGSTTLQQGGNTLLNAEANGDFSTTDNFSEDFSAEEYNLLTGTPITGTVGGVRNLQVGQQVGGVVVTPIISSESARISQSQTAFRNNSSNNPSDRTESGGGERFVVRLSQPLVSEQGQPLLLAGTLVVFEVKGVHPSGMVSSDAIALIVDEKEYLLPPGSISIRGEEGKPLIADKYDDKGPEIASLDVGTAVVGSLANVGRILNRPKSEDIDDYDSVLGSRRRSRVERGSPNILGAILEGGFTPLLEDIRERNKRAIAEIQSRPNLWYISPETQVLVFVNRSFDL